MGGASLQTHRMGVGYFLKFLGPFSLLSATVLLYTAVNLTSAQIMASGVIINELPKWIVFGLWFLLNIALFIYQFHLFQTAPGHFYIRYYIREALAFARGPALPINFNVILILLPVCRNILSVIRGCTRVVPRSVRRLLDKNLTFHKAIAWMLIVSSAVHVMAHYYNYERLSRYAPPDNLPPGEQAKPPLEAIPPALQSNARFNPIQVCFITYAGVTGHIITLALFLMVTSSLEFIRRSYFEVFWYTHHLFLVFLVGLGIHQYGRLLPVLRNPGVLTDNGTPLEFCAYRKAENMTLCNQLSFIPAGPTSWLYLLCGLLIYGLERLLRLVRSLYSVVIIKVVQHPNKTFEIQMRRKGFHADAGQYVFINCPAVAWFEWHPFTLTSAPEEDYFSVHIRIVGDWTNGVADKLGVFRDDFQQSWELPNIYVDGPFGTASEDVFDHSVGLLVGAGIGVTPFASVLKSIYYRLSEEGQRLHLKKVYFVWICPETNSFEWFAELFSELEHQLHERGIDDFLTSWIYLTRGWKENQAYYLMLNEGQRVQDGDQVDAITGLKAQTIFGRPEWEKIFENVSLAHPNTDVGVFFCGPSVLSHNLHKYCNEFTKRGGDTGARFYYNKENF